MDDTDMFSDHFIYHRIREKNKKKRKEKKRKEKKRKEKN